MPHICLDRPHSLFGDTSQATNRIRREGGGYKRSEEAAGSSIPSGGSVARRRRSSSLIFDLISKFQKAVAGVHVPIVTCNWKAKRS